MQQHLSPSVAAYSVLVEGREACRSGRSVFAITGEFWSVYAPRGLRVLCQSGKRWAHALLFWRHSQDMPTVKYPGVLLDSFCAGVSLSQFNSADISANLDRKMSLKALLSQWKPTIL